MNRFRFSICASVAVVLVAVGCFGSRTTGDTWLVIAGEETLTVADVGLKWDEMDESSRELFTDRDNPVGEFIVALARSHILQQEMRAEGYLSDRELLARRDSWLRYMAIESARSYYHDLHSSGLTEEDFSEYSDRMGLTVWYTLYPGTPEESIRGPEHLPDLRPELVALLDTLNAGSSAAIASGTVVRLDSLILMDSLLVEETRADSAFCREFVTSRLVSARTGFWIEDIEETLMEDYSVVVDSAAMMRLSDYYGDLLELRPDEVVISSDLGDWTAQDLVDFLSFASNRMYTEPYSPSWMAYFIENNLINSVVLDLYGSEAPGTMDSLAVEADAYMNELASELMYTEMVTGTVELSETDIQEQFTSMADSLFAEEERVFRFAVIPPDGLIEYREAMDTETFGEYIASLSGHSSLSADTADAQVTRPLRIDEVPIGMGTDLFLIEPHDSTWVGPMFISPQTGYALVRLLEVLPERPATLDEVRYDMEMAARSRLEEEATIQWMQRLEEEYGLEINEDALDGLPANPDYWSDL